MSIAFLVVAALLYRYGRSAVGQLLASVIGAGWLATVTPGCRVGATAVPVRAQRRSAVPHRIP